MAFHIDLSQINLDQETKARISAKINSAILSEIAHLDLSNSTVIAGRLPGGGFPYGIIVRNGLKSFSELQEKTLFKE
jgi:hypothetical protein